MESILRPNSCVHHCHAGGGTLSSASSSLSYCAPPVLIAAIRGRETGRTWSQSSVVSGNVVHATIRRSDSLVKRMRLDGQTMMARFNLLLCNADADKDRIIGSDVKVVSGLMERNSDLLPPEWPRVVLALFSLGFVVGPLLDGIHSRVQLQIYDNGAINLLGLHTNIWVPPMLGIFYSLAGLIQLALDRKLSPKGNIPASTSKVVASFISLAVLLELSAEMFLAGVPFNLEGYILFFFAELNWVLLENTWWGFGLASFIGVVCPLAEIPIVKLFGLWHYPKANINLFDEGFVSWVICCYFFYTPFISNLSRWLYGFHKVKQ